MQIDVVTIFPQMFEGILSNSIIKRAIEAGLVSVNVHDFREYTKDKHNRVDDTVYGGGAGMLISLQAITDCLKDIKGYDKAHKIITSPIGARYNQEKAKELAKLDHIIIVCGHYEGIDDRIENYIDEEISIGDYILTGGEIASLAMIDSIIRLIPGAIKDESSEIESFEGDLLEYPQFTKPAEYDGYKVPEVMLNGNHEEIRKYRLYESLKRTYLRRKDLLAKHEFTLEEEMYLKCIETGLSFEETEVKAAALIKEYKEKLKKQKRLEKK